jgi:hypothetical protein
VSTVAHEGDPPSEVVPSLRWVPVAVGVLMTLVWAGLIWAAPHLHADPDLHAVARFAHLAGLILGFGAVLAVDWQGLRWLLGRGSLTEVFRAAHNLALPIWTGLAALTLSGLVLHPDLATWPTRIKIGVVLVVGLNGLYADLLGRRVTDGPVPRPVLLRAAICVAISQTGWWTATVIGFVNAHR